MKTNRSLKFATIALVALGLSACGGGGGSDTVTENGTPSTGNGNGNGGTTTPTAMTGSIDQSSASIAENGSTEFVITTKDKDQALDVTVSSQPSVGSVDYSVSGDTVSITYTVGDITQASSGDFTIQVQDKDDTLEYSVSIAIENTSAEAVIAQAQALITTVEAQSFTNDIELVGESYVALQFIGGDIDGATKTTHTNKLSDAVSALKTTLYSGSGALSKDALSDSITAYQNGSKDETALQSSIDDVIAQVNEPAASLLAVINEISEASGNTPALPSYKVTVSSEAVSGFIGNSDYGQWEGETWVFADNYSIVEDAASTPCFQ